MVSFHYTDAFVLDAIIVNMIAYYSNTHSRKLLLHFRTFAIYPSSYQLKSKVSAIAGLYSL